MAFMMPVVKNDWDIYKSNRQRRNSECSSSTTSNPSCRSRKVSESSKSYGPSLSTSPGSENSNYPTNGISPAHRNYSHTGTIPMRQYSQQQMSSRQSATSLQSPGKLTQNASFTYSSTAASSTSSITPTNNKSNSSINKFHNRLVDRLKRSLKLKDAASSSDDIASKSSS